MSQGLFTFCGNFVYLWVYAIYVFDEIEKAEKRKSRCFKMSETTCSIDFSRRNPQDYYQLLQRVGSGTYGDVFKVRHCCVIIEDNDSGKIMQ